MKKSKESLEISSRKDGKYFLRIYPTERNTSALLQAKSPYTFLKILEDYDRIELTEQEWRKIGRLMGWVMLDQVSMNI